MTTVSNPTAGQQPVSVASSSSAGAAGGSVIDVSSLVSELVAATEAPQQGLISQETQSVSTQISALGTLKSALSTFQSSLTPLNNPSAFDLQTATSSSPTTFTATAASGAVQGTYSITVGQLAQAEQLRSTVFAGGGSATVGTGTLSVSLGGSSFNVSVNSANDTLSGIAAAINSAAGNPGVTATVLTGANGAYLLLSSSQTGAANTISVTETDGGTGLSALTYGTGNTANYTQVTAPQDAEFTIAGIAATSPSNTVTDAIGGVTLSLLATNAAPATLTVGNDTATIESNIASFVAAYNTLVGSFGTLGSYDATTNTAGPMMGNAVLTGIQNQVGNALYSVVNTGSSTYNTLASVGITTNSDGTLSLNQTTLSSALATNFSAVSQLFSSQSGVAASLDSTITSALGPNGAVTADSQTLVSQENALTQQTNQLNTQMAALTASMTQEYSALNTLLSSLQTTSSYLTQAFASLPQVQGSPNA